MRTWPWWVRFSGVYFGLYFAGIAIFSQMWSARHASDIAGYVILVAFNVVYLSTLFMFVAAPVWLVLLGIVTIVRRRCYAHS